MINVGSRLRKHEICRSNYEGEGTFSFICSHLSSKKAIADIETYEKHNSVNYFSPKKNLVFDIKQIITHSFNCDWQYNA